MTPAPENLIWIDLEMSGLDPQLHRILEVALLITDSQLTPLAEFGPVAIYQPEALFSQMDKWCQQTHKKSGLWDRVLASTITESAAQEQVLAFLTLWVPAGVSPMCGNTVSQDRRFLDRYMPLLERYFHYRSIDVTTLKELAKRWRPDILAGFKKEYPHQALADIRHSVEELAYYRRTFIQPE